MTLVSTSAFGDECGGSHFKQLDLGLYLLANDEFFNSLNLYI